MVYISNKERISKKISEIINGLQEKYRIGQLKEIDYLDFIDTVCLEVNASKKQVESVLELFLRKKDIEETRTLFLGREKIRQIDFEKQNIKSEISQVFHEQEIKA